MNAQFLFHILKHYIFAQAEASKNLNWPMLRCLKTCQKIYIEMAESPEESFQFKYLKTHFYYMGCLTPDSWKHWKSMCLEVPGLHKWQWIMQ